MIAFIAKGVAAVVLEEVNAQMVALAEDPDGDGGPRLEIARSLSFSKQDKALGFDTYSLSLQSGATAYGGVLSYRVHDSTLTMRVNERTQEKLDVPAEFSIVMDVDAATVAAVRAALQSILLEVTAEG